MTQKFYCSQFFYFQNAKEFSIKMIHFKLISAKDLPSSSKGKACNAYAKVYPLNFDISPTHKIGKTKTIKKTSNPEWNHEFIIPFYICTSIRVEFWDDHVFKDELIGSSIIYFSADDFYQNTTETVRTSPINLKSSTSGQSPTFSYSISPILSSLDVKPSKKPEQIYTFLTFEPPIEKEGEEVQLFVYAVNENGTVYDVTNDLYMRGESEPAHCGPTGPSQVYYINAYSPDSIYVNIRGPGLFFYMKNSGYSGNITLNFAVAPNDFDKKKYIDKCHIFNNQWSVYSNNKNTGNHSYLSFPIRLYFKGDKCVIDPIKIPNKIERITIKNSEDHSENKIINFSSAVDFYNNNPDGIATRSIVSTIGHLLCRSTFHYRFELTPGNRYSLTQAFDYNDINAHPSEIMVGLGWDTCCDLDASILQVCENGQQIEPICYFNESNKDHSIYTTGDNLTGDAVGDDEKIFINLEKVESSIKFLAVVITSFSVVPFSEIKGAFCRIVDNKSKKEVMYLNLSKKEKFTGLLFAILGRIDGVWDMWPCLKFFNGSTPSDAQKFLDDFLKEGEIEQMLSL